jgi:glycosyltransferase involved in cell wall biosynthesis
VVVGEGSEKARLQRKYSKLIKRGLVHFVGDIYDESKLSKYFKNAHLFVSPGNIGLSCMHSLIYGTPVCTHDNMNYQMPEAECLNESNSVLFKRGDVSSLTGAIKKGLLLKDSLETEDKCRNTILKTYTSKNQAQIIKTFLDSL